MQKLIDLILISDHPTVIAAPPVINALVKFFSRQKKLIGVNYRTFSEANADILGSWRPEARIRLAADLNISPEYASILLKNSLLATPHVNGKVDELYDIYNNYRKYLDYNDLALNLYRHKTVIIVGDYQTDDLFNRAASDISSLGRVISYNFTAFKPKTLPLYRFNTIKEEISYLAYAVALLIDSGIAPDKIKIQMPPAGYRPYFYEVFTSFNIAYAAKPMERLSEYEIVKRMGKELTSHYDKEPAAAFAAVLKPYQNRGNPIVTAVESVFNRYITLNMPLREIYRDLLYAFTETSGPSAEYQGAVHVGDFLDEPPVDGDYLFIPACNQDIFPKIHRNDLYLYDEEKEKLGLPTSRHLNRCERIKALDLINRSDNVYLSYPLYGCDGKTAPSGIIARLKSLYEVKEEEYRPNYHKSYSKVFDKIRLAKLLDLYYKYDIKEEPLYTLLASLPDHYYRSFNPRFKGLTADVYSEIRPSRLTLSYTALDKYYKCGFLFYLENILKIKRPGNEDALYIGNLFHYCLESILREKSIEDIDGFITATITSYLNKNNKKLSFKEKYFLNKYHFVLKKLYHVLCKQKNNTRFKIAGLEKEYAISLGDNIVLKGKIDKVMTCDIAGTPYALVLDYKSGNLNFDLNRIIYGLDMQLMLYFYFLNNTGDKKYKFGGAYLQAVLPTSVFKRCEGKRYEEQWEEFFRLHGITNVNMQVIREIDRDYDSDSRFLSGIRIKKDGDFYSTTSERMLSDTEFEKLLALVEYKVSAAKTAILAGEFKIDPKKIGNFDSCRYCAYRDICFREDRDYQTLEQYRNFAFIREDV